MSIIHCPEGMNLRQIVACALCGKQKPLQALSVGLRNPMGEQAFACDAHFAHSHQLVRGWTDFMIAHRSHLQPPLIDATVSESNYAQAVY